MTEPLTMPVRTRGSRQRMLLRTYAERFQLRLAGRAPNTRQRYSSELRRHILPALGRMRLDQIDAPTVQRFLAQLLHAGLAPSSACSAGRLLLRILTVADDEGLEIAPIDARRLVWPRNQVAPAEPRSFTADEVERILAACTGWPRVLFATLALSGLRIGEGLGLDWQHVDFGAGLLRVRQQASRGRLRTLKSGTSRADLPLHPDLHLILADFWQAQGQPAGGLLFGRYGLPRSAAGVAARHLAPVLVRAGVPHGTLHSFRHGFASQLWRAGANAEVIRRLMRHSSLTMTQRYSHTAPSELREAVERLAHRHKAAA